jgi:hypothetical protein
MVAITSRVTTSEVIIHPPTPSLAVRVDHHNNRQPETFSPSSPQCQPRSMLRAVSPQGILAIVSIKSRLQRSVESPLLWRQPVVVLHSKAVVPWSILRKVVNFEQSQHGCQP